MLTLGFARSRVKYSKGPGKKLIPIKTTKEQAYFARANKTRDPWKYASPVLMSEVAVEDLPKEKRLSIVHSAGVTRFSSRESI